MSKSPIENFLSLKIVFVAKIKLSFRDFLSFSLFNKSLETPPTCSNICHENEKFGQTLEIWKSLSLPRSITLILSAYLSLSLSLSIYLTLRIAIYIFLSLSLCIYLSISFFLTLSLCISLYIFHSNLSGYLSLPLSFSIYLTLCIAIYIFLSLSLSLHIPVW